MTDLPSARGSLAQAVEGWLAELGLVPAERSEREGIRAWDLLLDGRRRAGVRLTLILDPALALLAWVHYAPPLTDSLRKAYRQLLRWNDELPLVKFALAEDDRPVLSAEVAVERLDRDALGLTVARLLAVCDMLYPESAAWTDRISRAEPGAAGPAGVALLERYATELGELVAQPPGAKPD
ncbi:MAG TPA: YbjN domain-containing protein [Candidatus Limnocylindrales bacterium]